MHVQNIDRILMFRTEAGATLTLEALTEKYGFEPDGTNFYYGFNQANLGDFTTNGTALNPTHRTFFDGLLASIANSADDEKTVVLGLEPPVTSETSDPYGFIRANLPLATQLATELADQQARALAVGKRLNIVIRYASEMNAGDASSIHWRDASGYKATFVPVRLAFEKAAPSVLFSFSPALRADIDESQIAPFWPGDQFVDVIGGTWYTGSDGQRVASKATMRAYFLHRAGAAKPFAISETGGCTADDAGNDRQLVDMLHVMESLQIQGVSFKYLTFFLDSKWGADATFGFLTSVNGETR